MSDHIPSVVDRLAVHLLRGNSMATFRCRIGRRAVEDLLVDVLLLDLGEGRDGSPEHRHGDSSLAPADLLNRLTDTVYRLGNRLLVPREQQERAISGCGFRISIERWRREDLDSPASFSRR